MRPLMYGYCRTELFPGTREECHKQMSDYAKYDGYEFGTVFYENPGETSAFSELLLELRRASACVVLLPTPDHLRGGLLSASTRIRRLREEANAAAYSLNGSVIASLASRR